MYQRDLILDEARRFAQLLARLMGLKVAGKHEEYDAEFSNMLQKEYDTELEDLLSLTEEEFAHRLHECNYTAEKLNALGQMLYVFAQPLNNNSETQLMLKKVLIIFNILEEKHHYHSFENIEKRNIIYKHLNTYA